MRRSGPFWAVCRAHVGTWFDFRALELIDASLERVLLFSYPALVVMARAVGQRRWPSRRVLLATACTYAGVILAIGGLEKTM